MNCEVLRIEEKLVRVKVVKEAVVLTKAFQTGVMLRVDRTPEMILVALVKRFQSPVRVI